MYTESTTIHIVLFALLCLVVFGIFCLLLYMVINITTLVRFTANILRLELEKDDETSSNTNKIIRRN